MRQKKFVLAADFEDQDNIDLYAIHSPSEDFFLAFQLNKTLGTKFKNVTEKIEPDIKVPFFSRFISELSSIDAPWELIANHYNYPSMIKDENQLFTTQIEKQVSLIPSVSKVDYFLKVPKNNFTSDHLSQLQNLNEIQMVYPVFETKIKQNPNLIFD